MAIRIIEGTIGSGKTYYAVWHILSNYFRYDESIDNYISKDLDRPVQVYSNIERFILGHSLQGEIQKAGGLSSFFSTTFQKAYCEGRRVVYLIDEAQGPAFFHRKFYNPDVFFFFQYHRHYGCDIYFVTQDVNSLAKELRNLAEYHIKAVRRTYSMMGEFKYQFCSPGSYDQEVFSTKTLKPKKKIFALYSSMTQDEVEKLPSVSRRFLLVFLLLILAAVLVFRYGFFSPYSARAFVRSKQEAKVITQDLKQGRAQVVEKQKQVVSVVQPVSAVQSVQDVLIQGYHVDVSQKEIYDIQGYISDDVKKYNSYFLYRDRNGIDRKIRAFDLDLICRCNSLALLRAGRYEF
ncbi:MAG: hypothetical protein A3I04_01300 [Nitrospinae bacterium RIFCSPLOWO2_02_FULL_39_110]|nr:MAG: hypothetical protein A3I04_01300 [Nitrospinae bacterium RIFCSPLOWO2_02_FULL_39_110]